MLRLHSLALALLLLPGCTAAAQLHAARATQAALELTCAGAGIAESAGESAAGIVAAAACWLADYTAARVARLESLQTEAASLAQAERDAAAEQLQASLDVCDPVDPTPEQVARVIKAWSACKALESKPSAA